MTTSLERRRAARADQILDAAQNIVASKGLDALTVADLARVLDYAPAALYRYFDSKDALVAALRRRVLQKMHARQAAALSQPLHSPPKLQALTALVSFASFHAELPRTAPGELRLLNALVGDPRHLLPPAAGSESAPGASALLDELRARFQSAQDEGSLSPASPWERALIYWTSVHGVMQLEKLGHGHALSVDPEHLMHELSRALLLGWGARAADLRRIQEAFHHG